MDGCTSRFENFEEKIPPDSCIYFEQKIDPPHLGDDYMISFSWDEILSRFAGIPALL